jgi:hypothetical protein
LPEACTAADAVPAAASGAVSRAVAARVIIHERRTFIVPPTGLSAAHGDGEVPHQGI